MSRAAALLHLRWVELPSEHAWQAIVNAFVLLETIAPWLVDTTAVVVRAYPQEIGELVLDKRAGEIDEAA